MNTTETQYEEQIESAFQLYLKKMKDYGTSWRILRGKSITDQIFIKAKRIRSIQEAGAQKIQDPLKDEFVGIINYCIMGLIQISSENNKLPLELNEEQAKTLYEQQRIIIHELMIKKNHDYGEAWREMRISSLVDMILTKLLRIKSIEDHDGKVTVSEGIDAGYQDIVNYSIFALIKISEGEDPMK